MVQKYTKGEAKAWTRAHLRGLEAVIFPSFTPDLSTLDEDGIRFDVNQIIANGFASVLVSPESCGMTFEERKKLVEIVCDEAKG
jgi:dihydrodipicolinate synthase/N-acetylneuraminate lyase